MKAQNRTENGRVECDWQDNVIIRTLTKKEALAKMREDVTPSEVKKICKEVEDQINKQGGLNNGK